jgi:hypothetical protein
MAVATTEGDSGLMMLSNFVLWYAFNAAYNVYTQGERADAKALLLYTKPVAVALLHTSY